MCIFIINAYLFVYLNGYIYSHRYFTLEITACQPLILSYPAVFLNYFSWVVTLTIVPKAINIFFFLTALAQWNLIISALTTVLLCFVCYLLNQGPSAPTAAIELPSECLSSWAQSFSTEACLLLFWFLPTVLKIPILRNPSPESDSAPLYSGECLALRTKYLPSAPETMIEILQPSSSLSKDSLKYSLPCVLYLHELLIDLRPWGLLLGNLVCRIF